MSRKSFHMCVDFDVHAVTCPGVWLCPKGRVILRISMLGLSVNSRTMTPSFPLLFHEKFRFHKMLRSVNSLSALQELLKSRNLHMQLLHTSSTAQRCGSTTVLATFRTPVADVFYPTPSSQGLNAGTDVDLLLKPTACFPGIISPKAEISTRVVIEEVVNYCSPERVINPVTVSSKNTACDDVNNPISRQRAVCHSDCCQCCDCYKAKKSDQEPFVMGRLQRRAGFKPKQQKRLTRNRNKSVPVEVRKEQVGDSPHILCEYPPADEACTTVCKCILCRKYKDYFSNIDSSSDLDENAVSKTKQSKPTPCCVPEETKRERKSRSPVKRGENYCNAESNHKTRGCPCLSYSRNEEHIYQDENSLPSHKDYLKGGSCGSCRPDGRSITTVLLKSAVSAARDDAAARVGMERRCGGGGGVGGGGGGRKEEGLGCYGCSCGIYSCSNSTAAAAGDWQTAKQRKDDSRPADLSYNSNYKCGRQKFYADLEEYYRQLYSRAKERSSVLTCA